MKCPNCRETVPDNSLWCNRCGHRLTRKRKGSITVPTPVLQPSGNYRIWLEREHKSITAPTAEACRRDAEIYRANWTPPEEKPYVPTLGKVIDDYIEAVTPTRSQATIRSYLSMRKYRFDGYMDKRCDDIDFQEMINDEVASDIAGKTIKNAWGLCASSMRAAGIKFSEPRLPRYVSKERPWLNYEQIGTFLRAIRGKDCELAALLALHSLRESEIMGLSKSDYDADKQIIHVRGARIKGLDSQYVRTDLNKNETSRRDVPILIPRLKELLDSFNGDSDLYYPKASTTMYEAINVVCRNAGLPEVGVHGLRHSFASLAYHLDIKKLTTMQIGGWKNSRVLDSIYTHNADLKSDVEKMQNFFVQTSVQTSAVNTCVQDVKVVNQKSGDS